MEELRIDHLADRPYTQVSGGERQLALIARALTQGAEALLMDEPTNGLDYGNQVRLLERVSALAQAGLTVVFSTHHPDHALAIADRVALLREGRLVKEGPPEAAITGESLSTLYGVDIRTLSVTDGVTVCVPAIRLHREPASEHGREVSATAR